MREVIHKNHFFQYFNEAGDSSFASLMINYTNKDLDKALEDDGDLSLIPFYTLNFGGVPDKFEPTSVILKKFINQYVTDPEVPRLVKAYFHGVKGNREEFTPSDKSLWSYVSNPSEVAWIFGLAGEKLLSSLDEYFINREAIKRELGYGNHISSCK